MAETLLWVLPLVPTVTALVMLAVRDRRILSAIDLAGSMADSAAMPIRFGANEKDPEGRAPLA